MFPERFTENQRAKHEQATGLDGAASWRQQYPVSRGDGGIREAWLHYHTALPHGVPHGRADTAQTTEKHHDFKVHSAGRSLHWRDRAGWLGSWKMGKRLRCLYRPGSFGETQGYSRRPAPLEPDAAPQGRGAHPGAARQ
jgi:hypothetical protein